MAESTYTAPATYTITFPSLSQSEVKVSIDGVLQSSGFTISGYATSGSGTVAFTSAPTAGSTVRIFRDTTILSNQLPAPKSDFQPGASIKAEDLNVNMDQVLYKLAEKIDDGDISNDAVVTQGIRDLNVTTDKIANSNVTTAKIADSGVTTAKINDAAVTAAKLADGSVTNAKFGNLAITTAKLADSSVITAKIADDAVTAAKLADNAVVTDTIADANVTTAKIADSAVTTAKIADAELVELATMGGNTASALADLTQSEVQILDGATVSTAELNILDGVTATATELNQLDGNTLKTTGTDFTSTSQFPAASEIDARITARIDPLGGFEAIADEDSFPATAPPVGTVISIANANSLAVNGSGVGAGTRAGGSDAVVINGFPSTFNSTSLDDGIGLLVIATSTAHTYTFHRVVAKNEDVRQLSSDINDFKARYRIGSSNPTTDNDAGDLFFNTGTSKMLVRNAGNSAWQEVQAVGDFFINTISSSSGTGGGSATFNGSAYRFTLSNAPITAQQLLVSINGVVQKPNSGTSQPSEGFVLNGADIIFSAAPASGAAGFFITIGSSVGIGTPSDNTVSTAKLIDSSVTSAKIADGTIVNADVNASAAIAGTKISPNFGSQNVITTGKIEVGTVTDLNADGSATFAGGRLGVSNDGVVDIQAVDNSADGSTLLRAGSANASAGANAFVLKANGSATFGGGVVTSGKLESDRTVASHTVLRGALNGSETSLIKADGSATFGGAITVDGFSHPASKYITLRANFAPNASGGLGFRAVDHSGGNDDGLGIYGHDGISFYTAQTERLRIQSGGGISFNGDTAAANALDDYEEGTWIPRIAGTGGGNYTPGTSNHGWYRKVGSIVHFGGTLHWIAQVNAAVGSIFITGLPFTSDPTANDRSAGAIGAVGGGITFTSGYTQWALVTDPGATFAYIIQILANGSNFNHTPTLSSSGILYGITGTYKTT